jgi:glycosyltransferase involved in cell wall biosynthesis/SAM-dependent methyltransferase
MMAVPVLIPAYRPGDALARVVAEVVRLCGCPVVVVDDGSGSEFSAVFERVAAEARVRVVHHAVNLGKGAALKTAMNYALVHFPGAPGVVTADADGQHHPEDIVRIAGRIAADPAALVLGARAFAGSVPLRSRAGNRITSALLRVLMGQRLSDTQTGLRGIPAALLPHLLRLPSTGYEFELDMLIACKHQGCAIREEPIRTIYLEDNRGSHFHPIFDSMRIYFLLLRFSALSLGTAVLDNAVFAFAYPATGSIAQSQAASRLVAMVFNYLGARGLVFHSRQRHAIVLPKYVALVAVNGLLSYGLIQWFHGRLGMATVPAKLLAESLLFIANFAVQRDFVFTRRRAAGGATDWDRYYTSVPPTAKLSRRYTTAVLLDAIKRHAAPEAPLAIVEMGGANSCFLDRILAEIPCARYDVVDTNRYGLSLLEARAGVGSPVHLHQQSVLALSLEREADVVFSVGLIEHFAPAETRSAIHAHFDALRPGGTAILTFPTPTALYRATRGLLETFGLWKFPDERALKPEEALAAIGERGDVLYRKTLWPILLTQHLVVARKRYS